MEQTLESIRAVKDARVSMIVAINKIDKPGADIEATKKALYEAGVQVLLVQTLYSSSKIRMRLSFTQSDMCHIFSRNIQPWWLGGRVQTQLMLCFGGANPA